MLAHLFVIRDTESDRPVALGTISRDMRERKKADEALRQADANLARVTRMISMGEVTASIAHEVNQPLTAVVMNATACLRWLARDQPDLEETRRAVQRIIRDGNRASEVLQRIRAFLSRAEPSRAQIRVDEAINELVPLLQGEARARHVTMQVRCAPGLPAIAGDRVQVQQVLFNLALNGVEAMSGVNGEPRLLDIEADPHGADAVIFTVRDSGPGLDPRHPERIFEAFYTTKPDGMGMGLAISRSIVESHGGRIWAAPSHGRGTTFQFILPIAVPDSQPAAAVR
jgi:C4-dicarboxylate-specific signal transduction histidine kinase